MSRCTLFFKDRCFKESYGQLRQVTHLAQKHALFRFSATLERAWNFAQLWRWGILRREDVRLCPRPRNMSAHVHTYIVRVGWPVGCGTKYWTGSLLPKPSFRQTCGPLKIFRHHSEKPKSANHIEILLLIHRTYCFLFGAPEYNCIHERFIYQTMTHRGRGHREKHPSHQWTRTNTVGSLSFDR